MYEIEWLVEGLALLRLLWNVAAKKNKYKSSACVRMSVLKYWPWSSFEKLDNSASETTIIGIFVAFDGINSGTWVRARSASHKMSSLTKMERNHMKIWKMSAKKSIYKTTNNVRFLWIDWIRFKSRKVRTKRFSKMKRQQLKDHFWDGQAEFHKNLEAGGKDATLL